ncbi:MAG: hypothetical protein U1F54_09085 [Burkholderiales bacterium]
MPTCLKEDAWKTYHAITAKLVRGEMFTIIAREPGRAERRA